MYPYELKLVRDHPGVPYSQARRIEFALRAKVDMKGSLMGKAQGTRPRGKRIDIWVTEDEYKAIVQNAARVKQSRSTFLRNLGIGHQPKSAFDQEAIRELVKLHADQGRLGGLLKLWLSERKGEGTNASDVRSVLQQIESLQMVMAKLVLKEKKRL